MVIRWSCYFLPYLPRQDKEKHDCTITDSHVFGLEVYLYKYEGQKWAWQTSLSQIIWTYNISLRWSITASMWLWCWLLFPMGFEGRLCSMHFHSRPWLLVAVFFLPSSEIKHLSVFFFSLIVKGSRLFRFSFYMRFAEWL